KIFAMFGRKQFVAKLPKARVDALVKEGVGKNFDPGHGRLMKEWVVVAEGGPDWLELAKEAYEFVRTGKPLLNEGLISLMARMDNWHLDSSVFSVAVGRSFGAVANHWGRRTGAAPDPTTRGLQRHRGTKLFRTGTDGRATLPRDWPTWD